MNRKKTSVLIICALLIAASAVLSSCAEKEERTISKEGLAEKIENKTQAYLTDINDSSDSFSSNESIRKYLINWAETKSIRVKEDDGIVVMNVDGSENYKDAPPTVIICPYDAGNFESSVSPLVSSLYVVKNNEDTGRLTALFVPETGHDLGYGEKLKKKYFKKGSNVFCLNGDVHANVSEITGGASRYEFTSKLDTGKPKNQKAFKIYIRGIKSSQIDNKINSKINPVRELNTLLANLKKSSVDFEIISFTGGKKDMLYPGSCTLKITVDEDRQKAFLGRINSRIESFNKRKSAASDDDAEFGFREIPVPEKCFTQKSSARLVSFVYTLLEDEYRRDEETDDLIAACDVSYIRAVKGKAIVGSTACSISDDVLKEIDDAEETLCGLSGFKYKKISGIPSWSAEAENGLPEMIKKSYKKYTGKKLVIQSQVTPSAAGYVTELNDRCDILSVTVSPSTMMDLTGTLMEYLLGSNKTESD